ncbi:MAG: hypothetical protein FWG75_09370 [Cystobacterineae bacterium]|nr:hypothetical protein [Cystobacterineae bacterium]
MCPHFILWTITAFGLQMPPEHPPLMQKQAEGLPGQAQMPPGHPPLEGQAPRPRFADLPDTIQRLDETEGLREAAKTFEVAADIASQYAQANRIEEAAFYFGQAWEKTAELRELFLKLPKLKADSTCEEVNAGKELELELAKAKAQKPQAKQAACVHILMPRVLETGKQLALFQVLSKNLEGAKKTWEVLLALDNGSGNGSGEASYALGVLLLETEGDNMASLQRAQKLLQSAVRGKPSAKAFLARVEAALEAGGNSKIKRSRSAPFKPSGLSFSLASTPVLSEEQTVEEAETLLAQRRYEEALGRYLKLVDSNQRSARMEAGMAFALAKMGKQKEMAERMWQNAEQNPEALDALAQTLKAKGEEEGARWLWEKLLTHPRFGAVAKERLSPSK